jgi:hypothetical protein
MPKFEYKEYIDVPNTCSTGTKIKTPPKKSAPKSYDVTPQASYSSTTVPSSSSSTTPPTTTTPPATTTPPTTTTPPATTTPPTTTTPPATTTPPKQYSQEVQKYKTLLDTANKALQDNTPTVTKSTFYEEMSLSKEPKVFFKKYPYMVDVLALYTYEKSAEFASINSTEKNNLYTDIEYWSRKYSIRVNENTYDHISTYLNLNSLRSFYVNNQTVIDDCLKNNSCLTNSTPSTNTSTTVEGFTNGTWYNYSKFF